MASFKVPFQFLRGLDVGAARELQRNFEHVGLWTQRYAAKVALGSNGASAGTFIKGNMTLQHEDFTGSINTTTDQYRCPARGLYYVHGSIRLDIGTDADQYLLVSVFRNNVEFQRTWFLIRATVSSDDLNLSVTTDVPCAVGDLLDIRYYADVAAEAVSNDGWAVFRRVGPHPDDQYG